MKKLLPALLLALLLTTACDLIRNPGLAPNSIAIDVTGLPADLASDITITGPDDYQRIISETTLLEELQAGTYDLTANAVAFNGNPFEPDRLTHNLTLAPEGTGSIKVAYAPEREYALAALARLNEYRAAAGVAPVRLDAEGSLGQWLHARYLAENGKSGHHQDSALPWSTPAGRQAGQRSNVSSITSSWPPTPWWSDPNELVDGFSAAPFHFFSMLDPSATTTRIAKYYAPGACEHGELNCDGKDFHRQASLIEMIRQNQWPAGRVVHYPGDGQTVTRIRVTNEYPSPIASCAGYLMPPDFVWPGLPLFIMHGPNGLPTVTNTSLILDGQELDHCAYDADTYTNPDPAAEATGKLILKNYGAMIIMPRETLRYDSTYEVTVTYATGADQWQFHTPSPPPNPNLLGTAAFEIH